MRICGTIVRYYASSAQQRHTTDAVSRAEPCSGAGEALIGNSIPKPEKWVQISPETSLYLQKLRENEK